MRDLTDYIYDSTPYHRAVGYYLSKAAISILNESYGGGGQPTADQHGDRVLYARTILSGDYDILPAAIAVATNATIKGKIEAGTDYSSDLEFVVNSIFDSLAGIDKGVAA